MMLDQIIEKVRYRLEETKKILPLEILQKQIQNGIDVDVFKNTLRLPAIHFIAEIKKASPSLGVICQNFDPLIIANEYVLAGASAISIITEQDFFLGSLEILKNVCKIVRLPLLRKDFIIDPYQIYEARLAGANCVLLIAAILSEKELDNFQNITKKLKMNALVEVHNELELKKALNTGAEIIGINNRDLKTFQVDLKTTFRLLPQIPVDCVVVSESGITSREQIKLLEEEGVNAVLIGERLMRAVDRKAMLQYLAGKEGCDAC